MNESWGLTATEWAAVAALGGVATALVAGITAILVLRQLHAAREQLSDARKAQAEQERPYVVVSLDHSEADMQLMDLVVQNIGKTPARNVRLVLDPEPVRAKETAGLELAKARMFHEALPLLPPGRVIRTFFDNARDRKGSDLPSEYHVQVTYENSAGERWEEESVLDLDTLRGAMFVTTYNVHHLAKDVREMRKQLAKASVLRRRGYLEAEATVEARETRDQRVQGEQEEARAANEELVARFRGNRRHDAPSADNVDEETGLALPSADHTDGDVSPESHGQTP